MIYMGGILHTIHLSLPLFRSWALSSVIRHRTWYVQFFRFNIPPPRSKSQFSVTAHHRYYRGHGKHRSDSLFIPLTTGYPPLLSNLSGCEEGRFRLPEESVQRKRLPRTILPGSFGLPFLASTHGNSGLRLLRFTILRSRILSKRESRCLRVLAAPLRSRELDVDNGIHIHSLPATVHLLSRCFNQPSPPLPSHVRRPDVLHVRAQGVWELVEGAGHRRVQNTYGSSAWISLQ